VIVASLILVGACTGSGAGVVAGTAAPKADEAEARAYCLDRYKPYTPQEIQSACGANLHTLIVGEPNCSTADIKAIIDIVVSGSGKPVLDAYVANHCKG
jgi:hypothetical protein